MASHNNIVEESPGPLSNRFKQIKAQLGWDTKEDPVLEDVQETPVDTTDLTSPNVGEAPEEIIEIELEEKDVAEIAEIEENDVTEIAEIEENDVTEIEENDDVIESAEEEVLETEIEENDDVSHADVDIQTSPEEVSFFEDIDPSARDFSDLTKENGMYTVKFAPVYVQTPVVVLEEHQRRFAILRLPQKFRDFVAHLEKSVGEAAKDNREKWFKSPLGDDDIAQGLKTFLDGQSLKVKVDEDFVLFDKTETCIDEIKTPFQVRCILKASEICFGKSEFGTIFTLKQAQIVKTPKCKISKPTRASEVSYFE
jgi:hypothetical protein